MKKTYEELETQNKELRKLNERHHRTILATHSMLSKYGAESGQDLVARTAQLAKKLLRLRPEDRPAGS